MGHEFEERLAGEVRATPEQVWEAIATGPGIDSWFMGRNQVEPGPGGTVRTSFGGYEPTSQVTDWQPGQRLAYGTTPAPDGRFLAYEFLVEGRTGSTVVRLATHGFLPGDDWEAEFDAMRKGGAMFFATLVEYLNHFAGRHAIPVTAFGPAVSDWGRAWARLRGALGLGPGPVVVGERVRCHPAGLAPIDGVVYHTNPHTLGVRSEDALYRFLRGFRGPMIAAHHLFAPVDPAALEPAWQDWLRHTVEQPA